MLDLIEIKKDYLSESDKVEALKGITLSFRKNEFVSILGPSGCGKTTMLNLIGGLDHYTDGDLIIAGKSTKHFTDSDWDSYRNHSIGFVFQSYNLIPHQSVLANVELALTLSGVSKAERRKKAVAALEKVGLKDQIKKRPNQLSGGQMQRVAIARALVNDPEILLADEPTGALDSVTSIQIMDLLKEIAQDKLVIMVTHNPDLAEEYSTRIIKLLDGKLVEDTNPMIPERTMKDAKQDGKKKKKKPSMSFFTALSLSMNNLMTKKGRTILTSFAGSIGIIGIALILSLSNGINAYIHAVQEETLSSYPINIQAETVDMSSLLTTLMGINEKKEENRHELDAVYSSSVMSEMINSINNAQVQTNNLTDFKKFLDENEEIRQYISNIQYSYDLDLTILTKDENGTVINSDIEEMMKTVFKGMGISEQAMNNPASGGSMGFGSIKLWQEMLPAENGTGVNPLLKEQYQLIHGSWPEQYNEVVLVVSENNELSDLVLCGLGLLSTDKIVDEMIASQKGEELDTTVRSWSYEDICQKEFKIFLPTDLYQENATSGYTDLTTTEKGADYLFSSGKGVDVRVSGIIRLSEDANSGMLTGALGYTSDLTKELLKKTSESSLIKEQQDNPETDILLNLPFLPEDFEDYSDAEKITMIREYFSGLSTEKKASVYTEIATTPTKEYIDSTIEKSMGSLSRSQLEATVIQSLAEKEAEGTDISYIEEYIKKLSDEELNTLVRDGMAEQIKVQYQEAAKQSLVSYSTEQLAGMLDLSMQNPAGFTEDQYLSFYETYMPPTHSEQTLEDNLSLLGYVKEENPSAVNIYTDTFDNKDSISDLIAKYNDSKEKEEDKIQYTDVFAIMMSGITTIINAISYVLVAFVSISLVVSSIMIGIITYISVLERTKEIGILRAIGASKKDISRVFNAESIIEGFAAGIFGIGITLLLIIPINIIIHKLTDIQTLNAALPTAGYCLILISILLSFIAGLVPSRFAAKKDPVEALRTE